MFLRTMNDEQKRLFLTLAERAADANGIREESEENLLIAYADEMGIDVSIEILILIMKYYFMQGF